MDDNPYLKKYPQYDTIYAAPANQTDADGTFKLIVMPGQGIIGARAWKESYRLGSGLEKIEELKLKNDGSGIIRARPSHLIPTNYHTIVAINPGEGDESITCEIPGGRSREPSSAPTVRRWLEHGSKGRRIHSERGRQSRCHPLILRPVLSAAGSRG